MKAETTMSWEQAVVSLRTQPHQAKLVRECFYDDPLIEAATRYWQSSEWQAVRAWLPQPSGRALDIGAGRGISSYALARDNWTVTALEPDPSAIVGASAIRRLAEEAHIGIVVEQQWGESLPFRDNYFDLVHCRQVLHHARDLPQLCREIGRVLKPGGRFIASREHVVSREQDVATFQENHPLHRLYGGENAYLLEQYVKCIEAGGIRLQRSLNPYQSDINLFPETMASVKKRLARKLRLPHAWLIPDAVLGLMGRLSQVPGRLYTFVGRKQASHA